MHCATCKHWQPSEDWDVTAGGLRKCGAVLEKWAVEYGVPMEMFDGRYVYEGDGDPVKTAYMAAAEAVFSKYKAVVNDGSSYKAELLTRPDFGCVLHRQAD